MKNLKILGLLIIAAISFNSCSQDDDVVFIAQEPGEFAFTNAFLSEYTLTSDASSNIGERFTWTNADFEVPTNVTYELQGAISEDFSDMAVLGTTPGNELSITISKMLSMAGEAGLDNDPETENPDSGSLYFRLRSFIGNGDSSTEVFTATQTLNVVLPELAVEDDGAISLSTWGIVGSGYNNWGAYDDSPFYTTEEDNIFVAYATLFDGEIKFRENNEWTNDFGDTGADGTLDAGGDNIAVTAGHYKINLNLNDNTYSIEPFTWGIVGSGYNDWGASPDAKFFYDYTTDTFKVGVRLIDGEIKFRMNNEWTSDFGDTGADGTLDAGGDNIAVTDGHYAITLDLNNNVYTIETADLYGVVGSGYNDWGATQDFTFTEVNPGLWIAEIVPLVDGEIKFRVNDAWASDFGDSGADGTLDAGGDNIAVTAGNARIWLDITNNTYSINQ